LEDGLICFDTKKIIKNQNHNVPYVRKILLGKMFCGDTWNHTQHQVFLVFIVWYLLIEKMVFWNIWWNIILVTPTPANYPHQQKKEAYHSKKSSFFNHRKMKIRKIYLLSTKTQITQIWYFCNFLFFMTFYDFWNWFFRAIKMSWHTFWNKKCVE
jgi:hypothetical protein